MPRKVEPRVTTVSNRPLRRHAAKAPSSTPMTKDSTWTIVTRMTVHQKAWPITSVTLNG